MISFIINKIFI